MSAIPENRAEFTLSEVLGATGGRPSPGIVSDLRFQGVGTDTRANLDGKLFVALAGERYDAHDFLDRAASSGARAALVERSIAGAPLPLIEVGSTLAALGALARLHRLRFRGKLVAVGGSAGKTTTRSAVGAALSFALPGRVHQVAGNLNNLVGVPLVLLGLDLDKECAVIEIGTNSPGEVARLMAVAEPDVSVLTLIALEHTEGLRDLEGVAQEEGDLFRALPAASAAIGNADDPRVLELLSACPAARKLGYGASERATVRAVERRALGLVGQRLSVELPSGRVELEVPLLGDAGAYATLAALSVLWLLAPHALGDGAALGRAFAAAGEPGRLRPHVLADGTVVLDDTYNANPASMLASIAASRELAAQRGARLVLVLGEMRELGQASAEEHERIGQVAAESGATALIALAGDAERYHPPPPPPPNPATFAPDAGAALAPLLEKLSPGDVVLVKASRGVRAERVVEGVIRARSTGTP